MYFRYTGFANQLLYRIFYLTKLVQSVYQYTRFPEHSPPPPLCTHFHNFPAPMQPSSKPPPGSEEEEDDAAPKPLPLSDVLHCLSAVAPALSPATLHGDGPPLVQALCWCMAPVQSSWAVRLEAVQAAALLWRRALEVLQALGAGGGEEQQLLLGWAGELARGALGCLDDINHSRLRLASLGVLEQIMAWLVGVGGPAQEGASAIRGEVVRGVEALEGREKNSVVLAAAADVRGKGVAPMELS